jgi:type IV pilus assembly protein PilV
MRTPKGYSLIEILVTLIIVTFGLLGIAGIIANSLKANQTAYVRSQANLMANDILERIRANSVTAKVNPSPYALALNDTTATGSTSIPGQDLHEWRTSIANTLPNGKSSVTFTYDNWRVRVLIQWDSNDTSNTPTQSLIVDTYL